MRTKQEIFNQGLAKLIEQGTFSAKFYPSGEFNVCLYKDAAGHRCLIGFDIPNDCYEALAYEGGVGNLLSQFPALKNNYNDDPDILEFLRDFQNIHDHAASWADRGHKDPEARNKIFLDYVRRNAKNFAIKWDLKYEPI